MTNTTAKADKKWYQTTGFILGLVLFVLALIFIFSNLGSGTLYFLGFRFTAPAWLWFTILLVVGIVIGSIFPWGRRRNK